MSYNPTLVTARRLLHYLRHGEPGDKSSMLGRTAGFLRAYAATPKENKYTFSSIAREAWRAYRVHIGAKRASLKRELGITEDKLRFMNDYLDEKQRAPNTTAGSSTDQPTSQADPKAEVLAELLSRSSSKTLSQPPKSHVLPKSDIYIAQRDHQDGLGSLD